MSDGRDASAPGVAQRTLLTYSVLAGLTPLIPVPFVDDLAKTYFRRRLVRALAESRGLALAPGAAESLASERGGGCLGGCLAQAVLYPLKKIFRKIFYFLEWKRAVDLASHTYHFGYLIDDAFSRRLLAGGAAGVSADELGAAIERVCREAPLRPVERAVGATFRQSKSALISAAGVMGRGFGRVAGSPDEERVAAVGAEVEAKEEREIGVLIDRLQDGVGRVPESHFTELRARLDAHLSAARRGGLTEG